MIQTSYDGQPLWILDLGHDGRGPFRVDFEVMAHVEVGLSDREERRPLSQHLRARTSYSVTGIDRDARRLEAALRQSGKDRVGVPLWPLLSRWSDRGTRQVVGGLQIVFREDWSQFEVFEDSEPVWAAANDWVAPLIVGRLEDRTVRWLTPDACAFEVNHVEASPAKWSIRPNPVAWSTGPALDRHRSPPTLFPFGANWGDQPDSRVMVTVERQQVGFGSEPVEDLYGDTPTTQQEVNTVQVGTEIAQLLRWTLDHAAGRSFWMPRGVSAARIIGGMFPGQTVAHASDTYSVAAGDWLAFMDDGRTIRSLVRAELVTPTAIHFASPPGRVTDQTLVTKLVLARFSRPRVAIEWADQDIARVSMPVTLLPAEEAVPEDEDIGVTMGLAWHRVFLYEFTREVAGETESVRLTSHEEDVELDGVTYTAARIDHGSISRGIALDRDSTEIKAAMADVYLLTDMAALRSEAPVRVTIREASLTRIRQFSDDFNDSFQ